MPLVIPAAVGLLALLAAIGALLLHRTLIMWLRPLLESLTHPGGSIIKRVAMAPVATLFFGVKYIEGYVRDRLSHYAAGSLPLLTRWLHAMASAMHYTYQEYNRLATQWADDFAVFRHKTLPHAISQKVVPVKAVATHAGALAGRVGARERANSKRFTHGIDRLRKETGLLAGILLGIDILVKGRHAHGHHTDHTRVLPKAAADAHRAKSLADRLAEELTDTRARLKRLEKALALGVIAGLVFKVLARVAPWLFCRNVKKLGNVACGLSPSTMSALEALLLGTLAIGSLEELARFTIAIEDDVANEVKTLLGA